MNHELSLRPGQTVEVTRKHRTGWWEGLLGDGKKGWFPSNVLAPSPSSGVEPSEEQAHQLEGAPSAQVGSNAAQADITKAPGYGAYAKRPPPATLATAVATASTSQAEARAHVTARSGVARESSSRRDARIPAALAKETMELLRQLKLAASSLREGAHAGGSDGGASGTGGRVPASALPAPLACEDAALEAEAEVATLRAQLAARERTIEEQQAALRGAEQGRKAAEEECARVAAELRACAEERDDALKELEVVKQDPDLYFAGIVGGRAGRGGARRAGVEWGEALRERRRRRGNQACLLRAPGLRWISMRMRLTLRHTGIQRRCRRGRGRGRGRGREGALRVSG